MGLVVARRSVMVTLDGSPHQVRRGSIADADHPVVKKAPELWRELKVDYPAPAKPAAKATKATRKAN